MNVKSKENVENSAVELVIEVGAQEFEAALDKGQHRRPRLPEGQGPPEDHRGYVRLRRVL